MNIVQFTPTRPQAPDAPGEGLSPFMLIDPAFLGELATENEQLTAEVARLEEIIRHLVAHGLPSPAQRAERNRRVRELLGEVAGLTERKVASR